MTGQPDDSMKELIKSALREVLDERDQALDAALEEYGLDSSEPLLPPGPYDDFDDLEDLREHADELLSDLAESARAFLEALKHYRSQGPETSPEELADELHDIVMELEAAAQDSHDAIDDLMDAAELAEDREEGDGELN